MSGSELWLVVAVVVVIVILFRLKGGKKVSSEIVKAKLAAGAVILDVRTPQEFRGGAYPGAVNIPVQELGARIGEVPRGRPVVVYCASGMRSASAVALLQRAGLADVVNAGGLGDMPR